jgi:LacI family transcriptional regulator
MHDCEQITMADVAQSAGVSASAVSAAFSNRASTTVLRDETRQRILRAAEKLGYRPNILSRSFIKQQSFLIGLIVRESFFVFALETIKGIEEVIQDTDYSLLTYYHGSDAATQSEHLRKSLGRRVDGLIIAGAPEHLDGPIHKIIKRLREKRTPVVQLYRPMFPDAPVVMTDDRQTGRLATRHLLELGHRRIAHVTHSFYDDLELPGQYADARNRFEGYREAMLDAGLEPRVVTFSRDSHKLKSKDYTACCVDPARILVAEGYTAATVFNDHAAIGLIHAFSAMGVRVPADISLVGYDNVESSELVRPALTTLQPATMDVGRAAARMILDMMEGKAVNDVVLTPELIVRESSGPVSNHVA